MSVWVQKLSEVKAYENCLIMYFTIDLNWGHLVGVFEGNPSSIRLYFSDINCNTDPKSFRRHLSFDSGYVFRDQQLFPKKTPKVHLYPSLTSTLSSILRQVDRKGFELIRREKRSDCLRSFFTQCFCLRSIAWNNFWERTLEKKTQIKSPQFLLTVNSLASTNKTVTGCTLFLLVRSKILKKGNVRK